MKKYKRKTEADREEDDEIRRGNFHDQVHGARSRPNKKGDLRYPLERDSEVRNLWLGDIDPMDIENDSLEHQIEGFRFIDPEK